MSSSIVLSQFVRQLSTPSGPEQLFQHDCGQVWIESALALPVLWFKDELKKRLGIEFELWDGQEVTIPRLEQELQGLSLLPRPHILLLESDKVRSKEREWLSNTTLPSDRLLVGHIRNSKTKFSSEGKRIQIKSDPFWETPNLIDALALRLHPAGIGPDAAQAIEESVGQAPLALCSCLQLLNGLYPEARLSRAHVEKAMRVEVLDNFKLSKLLSSGRTGEYWGQIKRCHEIDVLRGHATFMQGHFIKVLEAKQTGVRPTKLNRYQRQILDEASHRKLEEIELCVQVFAALEHTCKASPDQLRDTLEQSEQAFLLLGQ